MKSLYNFYLDDDIKDVASEKIERLAGAKSKGQLSSLIRVLLLQFVATPDEEIDPKLVELVQAEYCNTNGGKRSNL